MYRCWYLLCFFIEQCNESCKLLCRKTNTSCFLMASSKQTINLAHESLQESTRIKCYIIRNTKRTHHVFSVVLIEYQYWFPVHVASTEYALDVSWTFNHDTINGAIWFDRYSHRIQVAELFLILFELFEKGMFLVYKLLIRLDTLEQFERDGTLPVHSLAKIDERNVLLNREAHLTIRPDMRFHEFREGFQCNCLELGGNLCILACITEETKQCQKRHIGRSEERR